MNSYDQGYDKHLLLLSVALNVFFIGVLLGASSYYSMWNDVKPVAYTESSATPADPVQQLPEAKRQLVKSGIEAIQKEVTDARTEVGKLRKESLKLLTADPFNEKAYLDANKHMYERVEQLKLHTAHTVADLANKLTASERKIVAQAIAHIYPPEPHQKK